MADAMDTLKNILGDDAEDKIKTVMNSLSSADNTSEGFDSSNGLNQIMQIKNDSAVRLLGLTNVTKMLKK